MVMAVRTWLEPYMRRRGDEVHNGNIEVIW